MRSTEFPRILTNIQEPRVAKFWNERTDYHADLRGGAGWLSDIRAALKLLRLCKDYDVLAIGSLRASYLFLLLARVLRSRTPPACVIPCILDVPRHGLWGWIKRVQLRWMVLTAAKLVVWCRHEVDDYASALSVPSDKFAYIPHHHTLEGYEYEVSSGDYLFAGGDSHRDYPTLLRAIDGLNLRTLIATRRSDWHGGCAIPPQVTASPASHADFRKLMAGSRLVVVPMGGDYVHIAGEQTYLNAMAMGKPVIVTADRGATEYIDDGVNGLIVPPGNAPRLRRAIESVVGNPDLAARLGTAASRAYVEYSTTLCMQRILDLVEDLGTEPSGCGRLRLTQPAEGGK